MKVLDAASEQDNFAPLPAGSEYFAVAFSLDGKYAYPSTGEVIDPKTRKIVAALTDETGAAVHSEKILEIIFDRDGKPLRTGDQFGLGRATR